MTADHRVRLADLSEGTATGLLAVPVATFVVGMAGLFAGTSLGWWCLPIALSLVVLALIAVRGRRGAAAVLPVILLCLLVSGAYALAVPDMSWDGLWYQQEAVIQLGRGWNPLRESVLSYGTPRHAAMWIDFYPRAQWIASAPWYLASGRIDLAKIYNLVVLFASALLTFAALLRLTSLRTATAAWLAVLAATNPVLVYQSTTFMIDGTLSALLLVLATSLWRFGASEDWHSLVPAWLASIYLCNLKFTGPVYVALFVATALAIELLRHRRRASRVIVGSFFVLAAGATGVLGYSPYVSNTLQHGSPFYPLRGAGAFDISSQDRPINLDQQNRVVRFVVSTFSRTANEDPATGTTLKVPFTVHRSELFMIEHLTAGGFGPLYGGALLLAFLVLGYAAVRPSREGWSRERVVLIATGGILFSMFVHTEAWWVRYAPQAWLIPVLAYLAVATRHERVFRWGRRAIAGAVTVNLVLVCVGFAIAQRHYRDDAINALEGMTAHTGPVHVYLHAFPAYRRRLDEAGIPYLEIPPPAYSQDKAAMEARNFMPPEPPLPPGVARNGVAPHARVFWY